MQLYSSLPIAYIMTLVSYLQLASESRGIQATGKVLYLVENKEGQSVL